jgi:hypothetical protein
MIWSETILDGKEPVNMPRLHAAGQTAPDGMGGVLRSL